MRTRCCHTFLAFLLKFLNFLQTFIGVSIIVYSVYMLNQWNNHSKTGPPSSPSPNYLDAVPSSLDPARVPDNVTPLSIATDLAFGLNNRLNLHFHDFPAPWFIYAFMGLGVLVCCVTSIGHIAAEAINGCCLCFYTLLKAVLLSLEAGLVAFIALDHHWEKDLPFDPTGELDRVRAFIEHNVDVCMWVGIIVIAVQASSLLLAVILRAMVSSQRGDDDIEGDYDTVRNRAWEPLLNPHFSPASGSVKGDAKGIHSDIWSSRMREKYHLQGGDVKNNLLNQNAPVTSNNNK